MATPALAQVTPANAEATLKKAIEMIQLLEYMASYARGARPQEYEDLARSYNALADDAATKLDAHTIGP